MTLQRTYPDGGVTPSSYIPADVDMAELAARLGSPDRYRREGRVISIADFSPGRDGWYTNNPEYVFISSKRAYSGIASMAIKNADHLTGRGLEKYLPITVNLKLGFSFFVSILTHAEQQLFMRIRISNGIVNSEAVIRLSFSNGAVEYKNSAGVYTSIITDPNLSSLGKWVNLKLIVDFETRKYLRFFVNNVDVLSGIAPLDMFNYATVAEYLTICSIFGLSTLAPNLTDMFIDSPIITINEF